MNNWDDLRFFLALAREGSITAASKRLNVNHSTVSRRISGLEEKYGVRLFERNQDGFEMTEAAGAIYELALELEAKHLQVTRTLHGRDAMLRGRIDLTMPHDIFEFCLADEVLKFTQLYPDIELNLIVAKGVKNLANREADLAIRLTGSPPEYLVGRRVVQLQHGIYAGRDYDLAGTVGVVTWSNDNDVPEWAQNAFADVKIALRVDDLYAMYAAVQAGFGVARMPCYLPDAVFDGLVFRLPVLLPPSPWSVWVLNHVDLRKTARIQKCRQFLLDVLEAKKGLFAGDCSRYVNG